MTWVVTLPIWKIKAGDGTLDGASLRRPHFQEPPPPPVKDQGPYKVSRTGMIPRALERYLGQLGHWRSGGNDC